MIALSKHRGALANLGRPLEALQTLDDLIAYYTVDKPGPAYLKVKYACGEPDIQIDRQFMIEVLKNQRAKFVEYLATLGIDAEK